MSTKKKLLIVNEFISLVKENEYDKISVTDLVASCNISRQTFYYHFDDIDHMIKWAFDYEMHEMLTSIDENSNYFEALSLFTSLLNKYHFILKNSLKTTKSVFIFNLLYQTIFDYSIEYYKQSPKHRATLDSQRFWLSYTSSALTGLIFLEVQKEKPDYQSIVKQISNTFTSNK